MSCEFLTLFGTIPDEAVQTRLPAGTTVERVQIFKDSRLMRLALAFPVLVRGTAVEDVAAALEKALQLDKVEIDVQMPPESFSEAYFSTLVGEVNRAVAASNGFFKDAVCTLRGNDFIITLQHGGAEILKSCECDRLMEKLVMQRFSRAVQVFFEGREIEATDDDVVHMIRTAEDDNLRSKGVDPREARAMQEKPKAHRIAEGIPLYLETAKPIYGNKITKDPTPLAQISVEDGSCVVWGTIFRFDSRETRDRRSCIITFNISDNTYAYSCKVFERKENCDQLLSKL
ncbi:MAG: hypothetical protein II804_06105, partial [Clostridia bacterium]|nr:hypothetical protein [Clostridia bacterium]